MARGELMKKLLASYGRDDEFRAIAEQIIVEEEKKNNKVLARTLRKTLEGGPTASKPMSMKSLAPLIPFPDAAKDFVERIEPTHTTKDVVLSASNTRVFIGLLREFRRAEEIRRRGLPVRSKLLFCGPPGCGKTISAEVFAAELGLPMFAVKLDQIISSYLGETASNLRKIFDFSRKQPCVLFLDEFDALARSRDDSSEHNELRRVVNSLLLFIDRLRPQGFLIAATNLDHALDNAIWRRFDEVIWFDKPDEQLIGRYLRTKFRNVPTAFNVAMKAGALCGLSYAEIERICIQAMKSAVIEKRLNVTERDFNTAVLDEKRRKAGQSRLISQS